MSRLTISCRYIIIVIINLHALQIIELTRWHTDGLRLSSLSQANKTENRSEAKTAFWRFTVASRRVVTFMYANETSQGHITRTDPVLLAHVWLNLMLAASTSLFRVTWSPAFSLLLGMREDSGAPEAHFVELCVEIMCDLPVGKSHKLADEWRWP